MPRLFEKETSGRFGEPHIVEDDVSVISGSGIIIVTRRVRNMLAVQPLLGRVSRVARIEPDRFGLLFLNGEQVTAIDLTQCVGYRLVTQTDLPSV
ncbi:MAG TPA: hypothetical protein VFG51_03135 [Candidatus Saccharimonadia bacterium]|nr:hypothetical protein [Candidatus Saccharimonadia bacterium]